MAKNRMIRAEVWTDDKFVSLTPLARLLFIGMWNFACDNGHLDDSVLQLKMRVLPADNCDASELLDELLSLGMVVRENGYLKIANLSTKQPLDLRYLQFCDNCDIDPNIHFAREDKRDGKGQNASGSRVAREQRASGPRRGDGDGDGDGVKANPRARGEMELNKRTPEHPIPEDWKPSEKHNELAASKGLDVAEQAFRFRNHALANDRRQRNWNAAFNTWLSKATDYAPAKPAQPSKAGEWWR
jgi:hypothetical protein